MRAICSLTAIFIVFHGMQSSMRQKPLRQTKTEDFPSHSTVSTDTILHLAFNSPSPSLSLSCIEKVAIKILDKTKLDERTQRLLLREITSMERLHHPNIIRLYEVIETPNEIHIVTEYAPGGELYTRISKQGKFSENEAKCIFAQIIAAVDHMVTNTSHFSLSSPDAPRFACSMERASSIVTSKVKMSSSPKHI